MNKDIKITYTKTCTKIYNSYLLKTNTELNKIVLKLMKEREEKKLPVTRNFESYKKEIIAHNRLYNLGLFRSHTKDADLEEDMDLAKKIIWAILGS